MPRCCACCATFVNLLRHATRKLLPCIVMAAILLSLFGAAVPPPEPRPLLLGRARSATAAHPFLDPHP
eukprot:5545933-Prymnesium_polylepis.1